jgi:hypothetical protein
MIAIRLIRRVLLNLLPGAILGPERAPDAEAR